MASEIKVDTVSEKTSGSGVTIDGLLIKDGGISGDVSLIGTTPTFTIGDAGAEDAALVFDGNAQDFYIALDDSADDLVIGKGSAVGTTPAVSIDENLQVIVHDNLSLLSDSSVLKFGADGEIAVTHVADTGLLLTDSGGTPTLQLHDANESIASDGSKVIITSGGTAFSLPTSDGSNGQVLSTNGSGVLSFATASSADPTSADGDSLGTASAEWSDLYLADGGIIYFGNDQDVTLTHDPDDGLFLKSIATGDDNPVLLTLQTGETDLAANDVIGKIAFQAPDEGTGTDAILVSAAIQAKAEGDHSSSSNATSLEFMTGASEAATAKVRITSAGHLVPTADDTYDLGTGSLQWRDIYTGDLNLNNTKTRNNEVDGTSGSWTIQEGEDNLFILNRLNGKKYKFNLTEVK
jgi:hypothetical protein